MATTVVAIPAKDAMLLDDVLNGANDDAPASPVPRKRKRHEKKAHKKKSTYAPEEQDEPPPMAQAKTVEAGQSKEAEEPAPKPTSVDDILTDLRPAEGRPILFEWFDSPESLRSMIKVFRGIIPETTFTITTDDETGDPIVRAITAHSSKTCLVALKYRPMRLVKYVEDDIDVPLRLANLASILDSKVLPNNHTVFFRAFSDDTSFLEATFQHDLDITKCKVDFLPDSDDDDLTDREFWAKWHVSVPLKALKAQLELTKNDSEPCISFEMRRDRRGNTFFGMIHKHGMKWQMAPSQKAPANVGEEGVHTVFTIPNAQKDPDIDAEADRSTVAIDLSKIDYRKLPLVFPAKTFHADYLAKFLSKVDGVPRVLLMFNPDIIDSETGELTKSPIIVRHTIGEECQFTFALGHKVEPDD